MYGVYIDLMETMHWTWGELQDAPADLVDELVIRLVERNKAERRQQKKAEAQAKRGRGGGGRRGRAR